MRSSLSEMASFQLQFPSCEINSKLQNCPKSSQKYSPASKTNEKLSVSHKNQKTMWKQVEGGPVGMDLNSIFLEHRWKQPSKNSFPFWFIIDIDYSSLYYTVKLCCLPVLFISSNRNSHSISLLPPPWYIYKTAFFFYPCIC